MAKSKQQSAELSDDFVGCKVFLKEFYKGLSSSEELCFYRNLLTFEIRDYYTSVNFW